jgi:hypothetical protein
MSRVYNFGEKETEYSTKDGKELPVWKSPKYEQSKKAVIKMLESKEYKDVLDESDFWILMNRTKTGKMAYTGLIISHNGCLKINDVLPEELKFNPKCVNYYYKHKGENGCFTENYNDSLIFEYDSSRLTGYDVDGIDHQMIFEIGEVSSKNCTNDYPYAMALKRCMDRVILKNSKLAYSGVYSDSEAEEFIKQEEEPKEETPVKFIKATDKQLDLIKTKYSTDLSSLKNILATLGKKKIDELSVQEASDIIKKFGE